MSQQSTYWTGSLYISLQLINYKTFRHLLDLVNCAIQPVIHRECGVAPARRSRVEDACLVDGSRCQRSLVPLQFPLQVFEGFVLCYHGLEPHSAHDEVVKVDITVRGSVSVSEHVEYMRIDSVSGRVQCVTQVVRRNAAAALRVV